MQSSLMIRKLFVLLIIMFTILHIYFKDDQRRLQNVLSDTRFSVSILTTGCFGTDEELFNFRRVKSGYNMWTDGSNQLYFIPTSRMDSVGSYLSERLVKKEGTFGICTNSHTIRIGSFPNYVTYTDKSCDKTLFQLLRPHNF